METVFQIFVIFSLIWLAISRQWYSSNNVFDDDLKWHRIIHIITLFSLYFVPLWILYNQIMDASSISVFEFQSSDVIRIISCIGLLLTFISRKWLIKILDQNFLSKFVSERTFKYGPYRFIRHPIYTTWIQQTVLMFILLSNYLMLVPIILVVTSMIIRISIDEKYLLSKFGQVYLEYMSDTKKLIPFIY